MSKWKKHKDPKPINKIKEENTNEFIQIDMEKRIKDGEERRKQERKCPRCGQLMQCDEIGYCIDCIPIIYGINKS